MISVTNGSHHVQSTLFMVNKDERDTKEGCGKSMKNALHVQWYGKSTSRAEATLNSGPVAIVELRESEGIRQAGRQLVSQLVSRKFR